MPGPLPANVRVVYEKGDRLDLKKIGIGRLLEYVRDNVTLVWDREGERFVVPRDVLINQTTLFGDCIKAQDRGYMVDIPYYAHTLPIALCKELNPQPRFDLVDNRGKDRPA